MTIRLLTGDCRDLLPTLADGSVHCVVTSPPYYGLRDYGTALWDGGDAACDHVKTVYKPQSYADGKAAVGKSCMSWRGGERNQSEPYGDTCGKCGARRVDRQLGLEPTPDAYLAAMVGVFREVRRVLRDDGTCWVNMGDSYNANQGSGFNGNAGKPTASPRANSGLAPKQLLLMPARLALALQGDGWWVRSDIIWAKANPMPESCRDRPTSAHEHVFLFSKRSRYFYDADAVREEAEYGYSPTTRPWHELADTGSVGLPLRNTVTRGNGGTRNLRNVWTIATAPYAEAHFATFPPLLAERCIRAGSRPGDTILDPFSGAGTTALVADRLGRDAIGIDLSHQYVEMSRARLEADCPLFTSWAPAEDPEDERMRDLFAEAAE
jgi:DNA modification methylase